MVSSDVVMALPHRMIEAAYRAQHYSLQLSAVAFARMARSIIGVGERPRREHVTALHQRYEELLQRDLDNVRDGLYPAQLLRFPVGEHARALPALLRDLPRAYRRAVRKDFRDLPDDATEDRYPAYYRRNFHWQTDGYFSKRSAEIYDVGVEILFGGTADVMRRQVIPHVSRYVREHGSGLRVLDIACGTGRTLRMLAETHPDLRYTGLDISPYYVQQARENLERTRDLSLVVENAESLPFPDGYFDVATCVYLFHELPKDARRRVMSEAYRVLSPGGLLVIEDSMQRSDSGAMAVFANGFARQFHEPYYKGYLEDDLATSLREVGFEVTAEESHFVAKVVAARR